jgi:hypothetical protein
MFHEGLSSEAEGQRLGGRGAARLGLALAAACAGCATTSADFRMSSVSPTDAAIAGRLTVLYNGQIFNENCRVMFGDHSIKLSQDGIVLFRVAKGWTTLQRLDCKDFSNQHIRIRGAHFLARGDGWVTDFGDVAITWVNAGGFKPSMMFGLVGALVDEASDDGVATVVVQAPAAEVRAAFRRQTGSDGKWLVRQMSQPVDGPGPPPPGEPDAATSTGPHFFCQVPAPGRQGVPVCARDQASCERTRGQDAGGASCAPARTAWCYAGDRQLHCFATPDTCNAQRKRVAHALDDCGEQY